MFNSIIWATDGSAAADSALPYVKVLAGQGAAITMLHCSDFIVGHGEGLPLAPGEVDVATKLEQQAKDLAGEGFRVTLQTDISSGGGPAHTIAEAADGISADVIVVGTRGHTRLGGLLVGSVTQRLLQIAPCPVLAVPAIKGQVADHPEAAVAGVSVD